MARTTAAPNDRAGLFFEAPISVPRPTMSAYTTAMNTASTAKTKDLRTTTSRS
jgi:hypothetical protein